MSEVFLSYRQTDEAQKLRALTFAEKLVSCGISVIFDQLYLRVNPGGPPDGWPKWSSDRAIKTERVLILGSMEWFQCFEGNQTPGTALGAACEAGDIRQRIYNKGGNNDDVRIVLFDDEDSKIIPTHLQRYHRFHAQRDYSSIVQWLGGETPDAFRATKDEWPEVAPSLAWPVADHSAAREAFRQLIVQSSPFRYLPITGKSETGKSHLTKQFLANAALIPSLTYGRFDFKGSSDMDAELNIFAQHLEVPEPKGSNISSQLGQILVELRKSARPTLLIFDTYELAGDAQRWMSENLLLSLPRSPWLRVVIVGQRVPNTHGEAWAMFSSASIELNEPTAEDWLEYSKPHKPGIDIEFVRKAHNYCNGKTPLLAQLLGPTA